MATEIILELSDAQGNNQPDCSIRVSRSDCFIRVFQYDCSIRAILVLIFTLSTIVDGQILAMLLEAILVNFHESISTDYYDYNYEDDDVLHFELAGCTYCLQQ